MPFALNPNAQEFVSPSSSPSSPISDSYMAQAMQQAVIDEWELEVRRYTDPRAFRKRCLLTRSVQRLLYQAGRNRVVLDVVGHAFRGQPLRTNTPYSATGC